jgi:hypothetical protein
MVRRFGQAAALTVMLYCAGLVSACAVTQDIQNELFDTNKVNLTDTTYAAADMLAPQTKARVTPSTPMRVAVLTDVAYPDETTPFGTQVANALGSRFVQLGYNVQSVPMPPSMIQVFPANAPVSLISDGAPHPTQGAVKPSVGKGSECIIGGTYTRMKDSILVNLRVIQGPEQRIIAAYDYTLPMSRNVRDLSMSATERQKKEMLFPATGTVAVPAAN